MISNAFNPGAAAVVAAIILASDALWLRFVVGNGPLYQGYRAIKDIGSPSVRRKIAMTVLHAVVAGLVRGVLSFDDGADAAFVGMLIGFYAYATFNVTMAAIHSAWGFSDAVPDTLYGMAVWSLASYVAFAAVDS
jgi:uncharacterized membrane protein